MFSIIFLLEAAFWFLIITAIVHRVTRSNQSSKRTGRTPDYQTYYKNQGTNMQPKEQRVTPNYQAPQQRVAPNVQQKAAKRQITPEERKRLEQYRAEKEARPQILERAAGNVAKYKENQTNESLLGNIEDLMVKGYDGELSFERDFVAEALDMINSFI